MAAPLVSVTGTGKPSAVVTRRKASGVAAAPPEIRPPTAAAGVGATSMPKVSRTAVVAACTGLAMAWPVALAACWVVARPI